MPTLNINGHNVEVDADFLNLSPEDQHAAVDHISRSLPSKQAMREEPGQYRRPVPEMPTDTGPAPPEKSGTWDFLSSIPRGLVEGFSNTAAAMGKGQAGLSGMTPEQMEAMPTGQETAAALQKHVTGELPKPEGGAGQYGETFGQFLGDPLSWVGPGSMAAKGASAAAGALGSEAAGQLAQGTKFETLARILGGIGGGMAGPRAITPVPRNMPPATAASHGRDVRLLQQEGVPLTAADVTGSQKLRYVEDTLRNDTDAGQREAFTLAATTRAGMPTPVIQHGNGGTIDTMLQNNAQQFQRAAQNDLHLDPQLQADLSNTFHTYTANPYSSKVKETVRGGIQRIADTFGGNWQVSGADYQTLRSDLNRVARTSSDPQHAGALFELVGNLDDAMERSIARAGGNPQEFQQARDQYRAILTIEKAAAAQGAEAATGHISPARLSMAARTVYGGRAYETGRDPFSELARAGQSVMKRLPDSGTSQRTRINQMIKALSVAGGVGIGFHHGGGWGATEGGVAGLLLGEHAGALAEPAVRAAGRGAVMNPLSQQWLQNQLIPRANEREQLIRALRGGAVGVNSDHGR